MNGEDQEHLANLAERAARLCKADLVTGMVGEFPELQGVMGGYYARAQGEDSQVADAIRDHYKPVGQGDEVPTAPVTVAVSLADKLDTLAGFFFEEMPPTGSRDPFALRRAALGAISLIVDARLRLSLMAALREPMLLLAAQIAGSLIAKLAMADGAKSDDADGGARRAAEMARFLHQRASSPEAMTKLDKKMGDTIEGLLDFFADRLKVQQREAGVRHDLIDAVFALGGEDDLVRLLARVRALQGFVGTEDGANLLAGYKRAANILKKEGWGAAPSPSRGEGQLAGGEQGEGVSGDVPHSGASRLSLSPGGRGTQQPAQAALIAALDSAEPAADAAIAREDFEAAMVALASLRAPIDAFFEAVTVNDSDPATRAARLDLLARVRAAVHRVADFSRIEG